MSVELRFLDHIKFSSRLSTNFACEYSEDDRIFVISDTGIYIIALNGHLSNPFQNFSCKNSFFNVSDYMPCANINMDVNSFHKDLERIDLYEVTMSVEYSANLNYTTPVEISPLCAQWSPRGIVGKTECLLAAFSNLYSLEVYVKYINEYEIIEYCMVCNITQEYIDAQTPQWNYSDQLPTVVKLNEMKRRVDSVSCTAFTWSHLYKINEELYCAIFVGHMNGDITVWRLKERLPNCKEPSKPIFLGQYTTQLGRIIKMHWHCTKEYGGGLSFADSGGKMSVLHIKDLDKETATMDNELAFWTESDNVAVDKITVMYHEDCTYIILVKRSFLIVYGLNKSGEVFDQNVHNVEHYYITGIHHVGNVIVVLTLPGVLKEFTLTIVEERICLTERTIPMKIDVTKYRTHGFFFSKNRVLFGMVTYASQLQSYSHLKRFLNILMFHNAVLNPLNVLWHNPSGSLRDYWDCFEVLRLLCLKDKRFPWLGIPPDLNYDNLSLLQLKTLRWLARLSEVVLSVVPAVKSYDIKPYIILHYLVQIKLVVQRLNRLLNQLNSGKELSTFQMRSIDVQNFFLKEMVVKNVLAKANVGKNFVSEVTHVMRIANELRYPPMMQCVWCGEKIIGPVCLPPHADSRCSVSMMPIFLSPTYKCPFCKALAHKEIEKEEDLIFCTYCDIPMEKMYTEENTEDVSSKDYEMRCDEVKSTCFDDCLKDDISVSDVEENESEFVIFSDSDDDSTEDQNKVWTLYARMKDMKLEDIVKLDDEGVSECSETVDEPHKKIVKLTEDGR